MRAEPDNVPLLHKLEIMMSTKRVTVPEGEIALVLPRVLAEELMTLMMQVRRSARLPADDRAAHQMIARDVIVAILEAQLS